MCGRITQKSPPDQLGLRIVSLVEPLYAETGPQARFNGAPGQQHWVIRQRPETGVRELDRLWWGLIPNWVKDPGARSKPINATAERVASAPMFKTAYVRRRCLVPVDSFFEWRKSGGTKTKQPYAIALPDGAPFGLAGLWESWRHPETGDLIRTFCIITSKANELVGQIHDRMPVIVAPGDYDRWLSRLDPDPRDLLVPYPSEGMRMWPVSQRVNRPENDDESILEPAPE